MFLDGSKFHEQFFEKGHPRNVPVKYFKIRLAVPEKIFKELLKKSILLATRVLDGIKFCEQFLKRTSQGTFLPSLVQIGSVDWEEEMFKEIDDNTQQTQHHPKALLEHVVLINE